MEPSIKLYHSKTSYTRFQISGHALDWPNQPNVFKSYPGADMEALPMVVNWPTDKLSSLFRKPFEPSDQPLDKDRLITALMLTHGLTSKARYGGTAFYYRSVASAGALYPFELYLGTNGVAQMEDGLYHHTIESHGLSRLRSGNVMPILTRATNLTRDDTPTAAFFLTSIFFRSSWKYRERAYRYCLLDTGHMLENLMLALKCVRADVSLHYDFDDGLINQLLGVDKTREVCLAIACVWDKATKAGSQTEVSLDLPEELVSRSRVAPSEVDYPEIRRVHARSSHEPKARPEGFRMIEALGLQTDAMEVFPRPDNWPEIASYSDSALKRRSTRNFVRNELSSEQLTSILEGLCPACDEPGDAAEVADASVAVGFLSNNVQDLDPGFYLLDQQAGAIGMVSVGMKMDLMTHVCLNQEWLVNAALHFLFLANMSELESRFGPRGYRYAMLTAGRLGQRIYILTTAMRVGCCGIGAFYDEEAANLLELDPNARLLYLVAAGPLRKWVTEGAKNS